MLRSDNVMRFKCRQHQLFPHQVRHKEATDEPIEGLELDALNDQLSPDLYLVHGAETVIDVCFLDD